MLLVRKFIGIQWLNPFPTKKLLVPNSPRFRKNHMNLLKMRKPTADGSGYMIVVSAFLVWLLVTKVSTMTYFCWPKAHSGQLK
jgi:hypothetical protein